MAHGLDEDILAEPLEEDAALVTVQDRGDLEGTGDTQLTHFHAGQASR